MMHTTRHSRSRRTAGLAVVVAVSLVAAACSSSDSSSATTQASATTPASATTQASAAGAIAENVDIGGGRSIYVECHGEGSPTVLLLSGGGTASDLWHAPDQDPNVYDTIGAQTRVCAYDRPGVQYLDGSPSRSTPVAQPITPQNGADDLQAVLDALDMRGPYVLAAHSFAGNIARVFAAEHPADVKGIVFVDVLTPELRAEMTPEQWRTWVGANNRTPEQIAAYPDLEQYDFDASLDQVEAADPLGPMPVVVLTASVKFAELVPKYIDEGIIPADVPRDFGEVIDRANPAAQTQLAGYFPGSVQITDTNSGHNIMVENAPVVIQAIEDVLAAVRAGRTTVTDPDTTVSTTTTAPASGLKTIDPDALQTLVDTTMQDLLVPGAVVLLRTPQGDLTFGYGTTEVGVDDQPNAETHFRIASITKTMTSAVILQLAQEGKLALDDPVSTYEPDVPDGDNITIAQLLEMRSGLYSFTDSPELPAAMDSDPTRVWTPQELLDIAFAQPAMFPPGSEYYYSNTNYVLLGLIIEQLDGRPLAEAFEARLFEPLGMTNTLLPPPTSYALPDPFSHGYLYGSSSHVMLGTPPYTPEMEAEAEAGTLQPTDYTDINHSFAFAAGGVISTAADLATWMKALAGGEVLDAEYQRLWQDSAKIIDPANSYNWYGYGIDQLRWGPNTIDLHGGQTPGFNSEAAHDPTNDMTLVIWTNLTMSLEDKFTAQEMMVKVFDQIYALSPLAGTTTTTTPP